MADQKGFLDQIGVGNVDETAAYRQAQAEADAHGQSLAARNFRRGRQAAPLVSGLVGGVGGLIKGGAAGRKQAVLEGMARGTKGSQDRLAADNAGITVDKLKSNRAIRAATAGFKDDGTFESRIAMAKQVAKIAQQHGDLQGMHAALKQATDIEAEQREFRKLGVEADKAERIEGIESDIGFEARHINEPEGTRGRAIPNGDGTFTLHSPGKEPRIVSGGELQLPKTSSQVSAGRLRADETLQGLVKANGGTPSNVIKMRGSMTSMAENSQIVSNIADNMLSLTDPQGILSATGKATIAADKTVSFVESFSEVFAPNAAKKGDAYDLTWNGDKVTAKRQHELATANPTADDGILASFLKESIPGLTDIGDALPPELRGNAIAAEQYWANVMELAYLDARLMEPSNRGLSDNDIKNALKRIGADTANPLSFAKRQREVLTTKLLPQLQGLGDEFTAFGSTLYGTEEETKKQIVSAVYSPELRANIEAGLYETLDKLDAVIARGRRGENEVTAPATEQEGMSDEELDAEIARMEAEANG